MVEKSVVYFDAPGGANTAVAMVVAGIVLLSTIPHEHLESSNHKPKLHVCSHARKMPRSQCKTRTEKPHGLVATWNLPELNGLLTVTHAFSGLERRIEPTRRTTGSLQPIADPLRASDGGMKAYLKIAVMIA